MGATESFPAFVERRRRSYSVAKRLLSPHERRSNRKAWMIHLEETAMWMLRWLILGGAAILAIASATAQTYDPSHPSAFRDGSGVAAPISSALIRHGINAERLRSDFPRCAWTTRIGSDRRRGYQAAACVHQPHTDAPGDSLPSAIFARSISVAIRSPRRLGRTASWECRDQEPWRS